ncbi:MAG TPA: hypothetical protein PLK94_04170 [Alphaproteobacteria bacterium]|nr:hypothetical protein [Alphaproteobacteria bacterium]HOO50468.1 hypothetical protein [Alphaproteobacteria bacterium]
MSTMISDRDIIRLHLSLEVPQAVALMLDRATGLTDDEAYALEVSLSEMSPEKCLLAAACVARYMAMDISVDEALKVSLSLQSDSAFDDYAPRYLAGLKKTMRPTCSGYAVYMQEDLESFSELFSMAADIPGCSQALREIAYIFGDQVAAHGEAMDFEHDLFEYDEGSDQVLSAAPELLQGENVIVFPVQVRRSF